MTYDLYSAKASHVDSCEAAMIDPNWTFLAGGFATYDEALRASARHTVDNWVEGQGQYSTKAYADRPVYDIRKAA